MPSAAIANTPVPEIHFLDNARWLAAIRLRAAMIR